MVSTPLDPILSRHLQRNTAVQPIAFEYIAPCCMDAVGSSSRTAALSEPFAFPSTPGPGERPPPCVAPVGLCRHPDCRQDGEVVCCGFATSLRFDEIGGRFRRAAPRLVGASAISETG